MADVDPGRIELSKNDRLGGSTANGSIHREGWTNLWLEEAVIG